MPGTAQAACPAQGVLLQLSTGPLLSGALGMRLLEERGSSVLPALVHEPQFQESLS